MTSSSNHQQPTNETPPRPSTHMVFLIDTSGSMSSIAGDVIGGVNALLQRQQADGPDAVVTVVKFDTVDPCEIVCMESPIDAVQPLTPSTYVPRGSTPLLDALGRLVNLVCSGRATDATSRVVFVVVTDGEENSSTEYSLDQIRQLITAREADGWSFVFLSADLSAFHEAGDIGFARGSRKMFHKTAAGTRSAFDEVSHNLSALRDKDRRGELVDSKRFFEDDSMIVEEFLAGVDPGDSD